MPTIRRPTTARQVVSLQTDTHAPTSGPFTIGESSLNSSGASAGTYGDATHVGQFTLGADGRITSAADVLITSGGSPGGTSGQIQYNNSGAFGGFTFSGDLTVVPFTGVATLASTAVTPGSYTNANITVDAKGRVTAAANGSGGSGSPGGTSGQIQYNNSGSFGGFTMSGDATTNTSSGVLTLATVNSNVGTFGDATHVAQVTVNAKGLATAASSVAIQTGSSSQLGLLQVDGITITASAGVISATGGGGALTLISEIVTSSQSSVTFSSIPNTYRHLELYVSGRSTGAGSGGDGVLIQFNGDSGANYDVVQWDSGGLFGQNFAATSIVLGYLPTAGAPANATTGITAQIFDYRGTTFYKQVLAQGTFIAAFSTGNYRPTMQRGDWKNTSAITSIVVACSGFVNNSVVALYGRS